MVSLQSSYVLSALRTGLIPLGDPRRDATYTQQTSCLCYLWAGQLTSTEVVQARHSTDWLVQQLLANHTHQMFFHATVPVWFETPRATLS